MNGRDEVWTRVGSAARLRAAGCSVISAGGHTIAIVADRERLAAIDNRCPHMGFPLSRGSVADGLLTCHWHHARFDLASGGTLDPFADDVRSYPLRVEGDEVLVDVGATPIDTAYWRRRLIEGLEQGITLVVAKAVLALRAAGVPANEIVALGGSFGLRYRGHGWGSGMTILTAIANVLPALHEEDRPLALTHGLARMAADTAGEAPRFIVDALPTAGVAPATLKLWFRRAVDVRDAEGAERVLQTVLASGAGIAAALDLLYAAATDHLFIDGGHELDFITKAAEYLEHAGPEQAPAALGSLVRGLCEAQRSEEQYAWRYPIDLPALIAPAIEELESGWERRGSGPVRDLNALSAALLAEEPAPIVAAVRDELRAGAAPAAVAQAIAHAAALRLARFPVSNEFGDWDTVHNTWSSCSALFRALTRHPSPELARGLYHAAMALYLDRFLMVPAARLPDELPRNGHAPESATLLADLRARFDLNQQVDPAARLVDSYLAAEYDDAALLATLGELTLREDAGFHMYQTLEAGIQLYQALRDREPLAARRTLVGVVRYLAAHAPTARALNQTVRIAVRLHRGEEIFAEAEEAVRA
ncbi:MAG TPA: Rieske (2Fe-2S) protein [Dehalococcoidia bacterium]|nr:Rieske (2Fe-2S) protein [Dehalococcoidia bacterium]